MSGRRSGCRLFFAGVFAGLTYAISRDELETYAAANRALALFVSVIPSLAMRPIDLVRALNQLTIPRRITLGMLITLTFFPLLRREVKIIREAMRTRGANSIFAPPFSLSLFRDSSRPAPCEHFGYAFSFCRDQGIYIFKEPYTIYRPPRFSLLDVLPILLFGFGHDGSDSAMNNVIEFRDVSLSYDGKEAVLLHASLFFEEGKMVLSLARPDAGRALSAKLISGIIPEVVKGEMVGKILIRGEETFGKGIATISKWWRPSSRRRQSDSQYHRRG